MAAWQYADYITIDDQTTRLTRLRLHIQEVSQQIIGFQGASHSQQPVATDYLKSLKTEEQSLMERTTSTPTSFARNYGQFCRGD